MSRLLQPVAAADLPEYPLDGSERLESHWFMTWERRRWLNSDMRLKGTPECRAHYFDLICVSFDHSPIGTLPDDIDLLARILMVDVSHFRALCQLPYGPLHRWERCRAGGEVRLMHKVVVDTLLEALSRKEDNRARTEAANKSRALQRLRARLAAIDVALATNDNAVRWIDRWFDDHEVLKRDDAQLRRALAAWSDHVRAVSQLGGGRGR